MWNKGTGLPASGDVICTVSSEGVLSFSISMCHRGKFAETGDTFVCLGNPCSSKEWKITTNCPDFTQMQFSLIHPSTLYFIHSYVSTPPFLIPSFCVAQLNLCPPAFLLTSLLECCEPSAAPSLHPLLLSTRLFELFQWGRLLIPPGRPLPSRRSAKIRWHRIY